MSDIAVRMEHVSKKFRKGEIHNSLRDLIPVLASRLLRRTSSHSDSPRDFWALKDISFEIPEGEAFGIIGPNGAGKSTMLKLLSRIMKPTSGIFEVRGRLSALIEVAAGFHPDLTGRENVMLSGAIYGMSQREIANKFDEIVAFSGLADFIDTPVKRYSSGMYARLGFSVAAHVNPDVLIVDEVLSVGDYAFQKQCMEKMREIIRSGATVLFVSHNLKAITELCARCLLLERGRMVRIGPADDVIRTYIGDSRAERSVDSSQDVRISRITVRSRDRECQNFESGDKAWIDIEVTALRPCQKLSVSLYLMDPRESMVMDTSTERLGHGTFDLATGETFRCTFELDLNLVSGTFYVSALIFRYDIATEYDRWMRAATLFIASDQDVRGVANCFPKVVKREILAAGGSDKTYVVTASECDT
jgi:ABC-type polysaccharide/polyol phosphate transport system ATPase subunit